jgi:hypothetical protein
MENVTIDRLDNQIDWYDKRSITNQRWFKWLKIIEILAAATIPLLLGLSDNKYFPGALGVLITIFEGLQSLNQYQHNWITYRATCEALKHEKYLYLACAGPYAAAHNPSPILAERVESLISREHAKWISKREEAASHCRADNTGNKK